ncbi:DUF6090 family protein [Flagellimonas sp. CMM7]|uniref:DUF6090 family protein n=1 Tax=Flagellimonas sp. CMM7 TaxID=2654676 RepID=UPI0013D3BBF3|nr:DUF6090 family protein [Flagellimonas sp. CMM7]UII80399.1 DUF6090 family protein [Flagellimonas sp. CMM7]
MIQFFRKIRQEYFTQNRFGKYFVYAIGEILLVVIGILIAVAINNRNEQKKLDAQLETYRTSLTEELGQDIVNLNKSKDDLLRKRESIFNYVDYYNTKNPEANVLLQKMEVINWSKSAFYTNTYTIEDLITTGNLSLFPKQEKQAILKLKNIQERYFTYETQTIENSALYDLELKKNIDLLFFKGYSAKQHPTVLKWKDDLDSKQFRTLNNTFAESLTLYDFQEDLYIRLIEDTQLLLELIKQH